MDQERIIFIIDYLSRFTDKNRYVSIKDIQDYLCKVSNLKRVAEVTIRRDIDRLTSMGNNIVRVTREHGTAYYALLDNSITFNEIRFIVDSISINKFLSSAQKKSLIHKFEGLCSDAEIRQLISRITLNDRCSNSLDLIHNLDVIHSLIADKRKINFEYGKIDTKKQMQYYYKRREIIPVSMIYFHEHFYLKCFNEADGKWRTYRVDRMKDIKGGEISDVCLPKEERVDAFVTDMFSPDYYEYITLRVKLYLLDEMVEHFGDLAHVHSDENEEYVLINVKAGINRKLYLWLMQYGDGAELVSPAKERAEYLNEVRKMLGAYPEFSV